MSSSPASALRTDPLAAALAQVEHRQVRALLPAATQGLVVQVTRHWPAVELGLTEPRAWSVVVGGPGAAGAQVQGDPVAWPLASDSAAVVILLHTLEQVADPAPVLAEAERVLMPFGRLLVAGFNPWSLCGLRGMAERFGHHSRDWWPQHLRSVGELRQLLRRLPMQVEDVTTAFFRVPVDRPWILRGTQVMEHIGPRLLPRSGGLYCLAASKRRFAVRPLRLRWQRLPAYVAPGARIQAGRTAALQSVTTQSVVEQLAA
ncbi:MAG: class I SAM-dependent methyltransferase [Immundisolibacter sp.]|uniref:class I SAM-dependent methyltransferase n=1 Tax=Immundisolibacter sp. TaxID=1934948 RepID=UPI003D112425